MMNWPSLLSTRRFYDRSNEIVYDKNRSRFEQDYDRIVFSQPFRSLQDKTQVFPMPEETFVHNRLTHSLEVSSVGRSLGKNAGRALLEKYPELKKDFTVQDFGNIVATACLAHDIGNPPFGHSGEDAISAFFASSPPGQQFHGRVTEDEWKDLTQFEGNAQGFRILNSPLFKGMELTFASYGAFTKYPIGSGVDKEKGRKSQKKYGYYAGNAEQFKEVASALELAPLGPGKWCRHPLAFLVEAADDICYSIIDFEDGCRLGLISLDLYTDLLAEIIGDSFSEEKLLKVPSLNEKLGILRAMAITQLVHENTLVFLEKEEEIMTGDFDQALTDCGPSSAALSEISKVSLNKIYRSRQVLEKEVGGFAIISRLMEAFCQATVEWKFEKPQTRNRAIFQLLPQEYRLAVENENNTVYDVLQLVTDYVSSLTDGYAVKLDGIIRGS